MTDASDLVRWSKTANDQDLQVALGCEVFGGKFQCIRRGWLQPAGAETDQAIAGAGINGQLERADRSGPIGTSLEHVVDPPFLNHRLIERAVAGALVELRQECVGDAIVLSISLYFRGERFVGAEDPSQDGVGTGANARPVLVLDDDPTLGGERLLAKSGCFRDPGHSILLVAR